MKNFYIVRFSHKHGSDVWPVFSKEAPTEAGIVAELKAAETWEESDDNRLDTYVEISGPFENPLYAPLRRMVNGYDDTGCEECGVVDEEAYEMGEKALRDPPTEPGDRQCA